MRDVKARGEVEDSEIFEIAAVSTRMTSARAGKSKEEDKEKEKEEDKEKSA